MYINCRSAQSKKAIWRLGDISSASEATRRGNVQATFDLSTSEEQRSSPNVVAVQFLCEGSTVSGVDFEITSAGYRVSLVKKRLVTGMSLAGSLSEHRHMRTTLNTSTVDIAFDTPFAPVLTAFCVSFGTIYYPKKCTLLESEQTHGSCGLPKYTVQMASKSTHLIIVANATNSACFMMDQGMCCFPVVCIFVGSRYFQQPHRMQPIQVPLIESEERNTLRGIITRIALCDSLRCYRVFICLM